MEGLAILMIAVLTWVVMSLVVGTLLIFGSCGLMNLLARRSESERPAVPYPSIPKAVGAVVLIGLAHLTILAAVIIPTTLLLGGKPTPAAMGVAFASLPLLVLAAGGIVAWLLPTRYGRAALVAMFYCGFGWMFNGAVGLAINLAGLA